MATASQIAQLLTAGMAPPAGSSDLGFHTGTVLSWDPATGVNTVSINGTVLSNLKVIQSGLGQSYSVNDTVGVLRFQTSYFVLGRVGAPTLSASQSVVTSFDGTAGVCLTPGAEGPLNTGSGPKVTAYIGNSKRVLIMASCRVKAKNAIGYMNVVAKGATTVTRSESAWGGVQAIITVGDLQETYSNLNQTTIFDENDGMKSGYYDFTMQYYENVFLGGGVQPEFSGRRITVVPL